MRTIAVLESQLAYVDTGTDGRWPDAAERPDGVPVVFLHGNPTSSYLWRDVIPHVAGQARVLAPDLIGMGSSGKPDIAYRFADHARYLDAWFDALALDQVVLAGHDWGGSLALDWAARHPDRARGVALVETFLRPMTWAEYPSAAKELFRALRTPGTGEQMALEQNWFIETALRATSPGISDETLAAYRAPYPDVATRRPLLAWPREIPLDGTPADVRDRFLAYDRWLAGTPGVPKLLLTAEPGNLVPPAVADWARAGGMAAVEVEGIGKAGHHAPEDQPDAIGRAVARWLVRHQLTPAAPEVAR